MKLSGAFAAVGLAAGIGVMPDAPESAVLVAGNFQGYLTPCGCTKPMSGGVLRMATAIRQIRSRGKTPLILTGPWVGTSGRQSELKAEAVVDFADVVSADLLLVGEADVQRLGQSFWDATRVRSRVLAMPGEAARAIGSLKAGPGEDANFIVRDWDRAGATQYARKTNGSGTLVYQSAVASEKPEMVGKWALVSPGVKGKSLLRLGMRGAVATSVQNIELTPQFSDDTGAKQILAYYLRRVDQENLLEAVPRRESAESAGTGLCMTCHTAPGKVWQKSEHAHALATLEKEGHGRDPDCVACHVVGLDSTAGFRDRETTPQLADVGCESCHGPGRKHATSPERSTMPKVGEKSCLPCHTPENSPRFDYPSYWEKIKH